MLDKIKENKKIFIGASIAILVVIIIVGVIVFIPSNKKKLEKSLKEMGKDFYENYYYDMLGKSDEERREAVARFQVRGININLDNLSRYNSEVNKEKIKKFVNKKTNQECNKDNTKVFIYPKDPYGKSDYRLEVILDCGFDEQEQNS